MFDPPKDPWEILPAWRASADDRRYDPHDRTSLETFLRHFKHDFGVMNRLRDLLASTDPVGRFTDDQVIETIAWRLTTKELVIRQPRRRVDDTPGGGGDDKSAKKETPANAKTAPPPEKAPPVKQKHWIGVKVVDQEGKPVKDVTVHGEVSDGQSFTVDMSTPVAHDATYKTEKIYDGTTCEITFPQTFDVEWWPQGGSADPAMKVVDGPPAADGDCVLSIAAEYDFRNYHSIWDQHQNDDFKKNRPNPNQLLPGDVLKVPIWKVKLVNKDMDHMWTFVVKSRKTFKIRMVLIDKNDKPISGKKWELKSPDTQSGTTGANGLIEITVLRPRVMAATLEVTMKDAAPAPPPAAPPPAPAPANPPPYPPAIAPADYKDKLPESDTSMNVITWNLHIGGLPPVKTREGALARLHNLGFGCNPDSDAFAATRAVKAYQLHYQNNKHGSGNPQDVQDDAGKRHDQP